MTLRPNRGFILLTGLLVGVALARLPPALAHLIGGEPLDLASRFSAVHFWFGGEGLYGRHSSTYPPASYLLLWPFLGWMAWPLVRWEWAVASLLSLCWLMRWCWNQPALSPSQRWLGAAWLGAMTATTAALRLGQLVPLLLMSLALMLVLVETPRGARAGWKREVGAGVLMLLALVKPSVSAPFWWLLLWSRPRAALGAAVGYFALTWLALGYQPDGVGEAVGWAETVNRNGAGLSEGYANLRVWMADLGLKAWSHPASLGVLGWLGWWTHRYRHQTLLLRLGVTALVARMWTYHNSYDDMLLFFSLLGLLSLVRASNQARCIAGVLAALLLLPSQLFGHPIWGAAIQSATGITMLLALVFLLRFANAQVAADGTAPGNAK